MNTAASPAAAWQSAVKEQFPELGALPETWNTIDLAANFSRILEQAARQSDLNMLRRVVNVTLLLDRMSREDETLVYAVQDILRQTIESSKLRAELTSVLNARSFGQLAGYIEYLSSKQVVTEMSGLVGLRKRGA
jgi:TRAP-type mannitol/chloroaromatic compound transport system substrate-binding protein